MIKLLTAFAIATNCGILTSELEIKGKVYSYGPSSKEVITLEAGGNSYKCIQDTPGGIAEGIKTIDRYRCGPIVVFTQVLLKRCSREDYNPSPDRFYRSHDQGKTLLDVQHRCIEDGLKMIGGWTKIRDKNKNEWELKERHLKAESSYECNEREKVVKETKIYEIKDTKQEIKLVTVNVSPVTGVKNRSIPSL